MDGVHLLGAPGAGAPTPQAPSRLADRQRLSVAEFVSQALTRPAEPGVER
jgi:hypothetical protein